MPILKHCCLTDFYNYSSTTLLPSPAFQRTLHWEIFREDPGLLVPAVGLLALGILFWSHSMEPRLNSSAVSAPLSAPSWVAFESNAAALVHVLKLSGCLTKTNGAVQGTHEIPGGINTVPRYWLTHQILPSVDLTVALTPWHAIQQCIVCIIWMSTGREAVGSALQH